VVFAWSEVQPGGPRDWRAHYYLRDDLIQRERANGIEVIGLLQATPAWAATRREDGGRAVPSGLYRSVDDPQNTWAVFVRKMAAEYRGRIDTWIIWNEVDIAAGQWSTWNGSLEQYMQLLRVAARAIRAGNPDAKVLPFGAAWWYDRGATLERMLDILASDPESRAMNYYVDAVNLHLYSRADDIPTIVAWYRRQLASRGIAKPIWISEMNAIPYDDPAWPADKAGFRASLDEQASYMVQAFATFLGLGVDRVSVNRIQDGPEVDAGGEPFGLLRNDGSTRPAFEAYQVVTRYFAGASDAKFFPADAAGATMVVLDKGDERVTVAWTMLPRPVPLSLEATAPTAVRVTKYGQTEVVRPRDGRYRFELAPATANSNAADPRDYVVGGDPIILVEPQDGNLDAAVRPLEVTPRAR
jgi:Glycosyl hydrolase catalytic core